MAQYVCASTDPAWHFYPSFDKHVIKIMDGERMTYFLTHSGFYDKNVEDHTEAVPSLFCFDKNSSSKEIVPLSDLFSMSGSKIILAEYNAESRYLAVIYDDFNIDLFYDNGKQRNIPTLKEFQVSGSKNINSITFDTAAGNIWIAAEFGYLGLNELTGNAVEAGDIGHAFLWIGKIGSKTVAFDTETAWEKDSSVKASSLSDFKKITVTGNSLPSRIVNHDNTIKSPQALMPLSKNSFAFVANPIEGNGLSLNAAVIKENGWNFINLLNNDISVIAGNNVITNRFEGNITGNRDGYLIHSSSIDYQLKKGMDPFSASGIVTPAHKSEESWKPSGSWDFSSFWFYETREGFYRKEYSDAGWSERSEKIYPNCPAADICDYMTYHPDYGMLVSNHGASPMFFNYYTNIPLLVSGLSGGKWTNYSPSYNYPSFISDDAVLTESFRNGQAERYPLFKARGIVIDPVNPEFIYFGSTHNGIARLNLSDLKAPILRMSRPNDEFSSWPGFISSAPQQSWGIHCSFSNVDYDSDGNLWSLYFNLDSPETQNEIWCWTKEDRIASINANTDPASFRPWSRISLKTEHLNGNFNKILALKSSCNKNLVVAFPNEINSSIIVYDHRGTIEDTSDDRSVNIKSVKNQNGADNYFNRVFATMEEQTTGNIWIGHDKGVFYFSPSEAFDNPDKVITPKVSSSKYPMGGDFLLEGMLVVSMCEDEYGRKWFGTDGAGVWGVNAELTEVIANFQTSNSPIPSNTVYGLAWNPETKTLMISTKNGLADVSPDLAGITSSYGNFHAYPNPVYPDYFGNITLSGINVNEPVVIKNENNETVAELDSPANGTVIWRLSDSQNGYPTGRYRAVSGISGTTVGEIIILK